MAPKLARRVLETETPVTVQMQELLHGATDVISLAQGVVHWQPPEEALTKIKSLVDEPTTSHYGADEGLPELREALLEKLRRENKLYNSCVMVTAGVNQPAKTLKGEFEMEGLSREELAAEVAWAARQGSDYLVKIGGCEAKSDLSFLQHLGVTSVVAPMIESPFAMSKYMAALPLDHFRHVGVTIETRDAVQRIDAILAAGTNLTNVTIGRSDLTASFGGNSVDDAQTMAMVRAVAKAAHARGLEVTMGGGINVRTRELLQGDAELAQLIACVETRKVVIPMNAFLTTDALERAIETELELLHLHSGPARHKLNKAVARTAQIRSRVQH